MASSGSITTNEYYGRSITLSWSQTSQNVANNTTTIAWTLKGSGSAGGGNWVMSGAFKAVIDGKTVYSSDTRIQLKKDQVIASGSTTISHNADGTKSFGLSCEAGVYTYAVSVRASGTHTLNTIPRASSISMGAGTMGSASTITITRASSSFTHTLTYAFGSASGTIATKTASTSVSWTPPITLAQQIPSSTSGTATITCDTYSGNTKIGSKSITVTLKVPDSVKPTLTSVTATRVDGDVPPSWGIYVQGKSKATLTINGAAGAQGSTISSYSISGGGFSSTSSSFTTGFLMNVGTLTFTAKVTDSRGRVSDVKTVSINVVAYSPPSISSYLSQRCNSNGTLLDDGTYVKGLVSFNYSTCSSKNNVTTATYYKKSSESSWTNANKTFGSGISFTFGGSISAESSYDIRYTISDAFTTISVVDTVSTASVLMDFKSGGKGIAIGKVAEFDNTLEISDKWDLRVHGKKLIDYIYPIGSIYLSVNSTNPSTLFGGTWVQLKDRFLLGAGNTYGNGATGGEATHLLTLSEIPSHSHSLKEGSHTFFWGQNKTSNVYLANAIATAGKTPSNNAMTSQGYWNVTNDSGGSVSHNNMPPFLVVYIWKRTN